ncbi:hypothetical protein DL763_003486 [Monosporascus cannonballus]|nr:hypothetical protein DL763_003486 [Monosporascus cannonballus]
MARSRPSSMISLSQASDTDRDLLARKGYDIGPASNLQVGDVFEFLWADSPEFEWEWKCLGYTRFIVLRHSDTFPHHCACIPISVGGKHEFAKPGIDSFQQGFVFANGDRNPGCEQPGGGPKLPYSPVGIELRPGRLRVKEDSRANYADIVEVDHDAQVMVIGDVSMYFDRVRRNVNRAYMRQILKRALEEYRRNGKVDADGPGPDPAPSPVSSGITSAMTLGGHQSYDAVGSYQAYERQEPSDTTGTYQGYEHQDAAGHHQHYDTGNTYQAYECQSPGDYQHYDKAGSYFGHERQGSAAGALLADRSDSEGETERAPLAAAPRRPRSPRLPLGGDPESSNPRATRMAVDRRESSLSVGGSRNSGRQEPRFETHRPMRGVQGAGAGTSIPHIPVPIPPVPQTDHNDYDLRSMHNVAMAGLK